MKYAVIGAGAMGYRYGILLQERGGFPVDFIDTWTPNIEAVRAQGGVWVSRDGEGRHKVPVRISTPEDYAGDPDVWVVFVKQMQLAGVLERCAPLFRPHQRVFSAMNGMGHVEKLRQYFPDDHVSAGTAMVATVLNGPGDVDFIGKPRSGYTHLANFTGKSDDSLRALASDLERAGLGPIVNEEFLGTLLSKVVFNSVVNTLCTLFEIRMGEFIQYSGALDMARQLLDEAYDAIDRAGIRMIATRQEEVTAVEHVSRDLNPLHYPSMYQDLHKNRPTEVEYINGYIARLGRAHDYVCRTHEFLIHEVHLAETARGVEPAHFEEPEPTLAAALA